MSERGSALPAPEPDAPFPARFFPGPQLYFWLQRLSSLSHLLSGALPTSSSPAPRMLSQRGHPLAGRVPTPTAPMGSQVYQLIPAPGRLAGEQAGRGAGRGRVWLGLLGGGWYIFQLRWCLLHVPRLSPSRGQNTDMLLMARCMSGPPGGCH